MHTSRRRQKIFGEKALLSTIVFVGHAIDRPNFIEPRFPPNIEQVIRKEIRAFLKTQISAARLKILGIAGGKPGGDILFHEACVDLKIETKMYLPLATPEFATHVAAYGKSWLERFNWLTTKVHVLNMNKQLEEKQRANIWVSHMRWMFENATTFHSSEKILLLLWDLVDKEINDAYCYAKQNDLLLNIIDIREFF